MRPLRIVVADDHPLVCEALEQLLMPEFEVVGTAHNGRELIKVVLDLKPEVVVTDIAMPILNGLDAGIKLLRRIPHLKIIFLTVSDDPDIVADVIRAGAKGYLLKSSATTELVQALRAVAGGSTYVTPMVTSGVLNSLINGGQSDLYHKLTVRQREILQLLAEGKTMKEAALILSVTPRTVAFHKYRIMDVLGIDNSAGLIRFAMNNGILAA